MVGMVENPSYLDLLSIWWVKSEESIMMLPLILFIFTI